MDNDYWGGYGVSPEEKQKKDMIKDLEKRITELEYTLSRYTNLIKINDYDSLLEIHADLDMRSNYVVNVVLEDCGIQTGIGCACPNEY